MVRRSLRPMLAILLGAILVASFPLTTEAHHYEEKPLQPGGMVAAFDWSWCTLNVVFSDPAGKLYIGTAAHCYRSVGEPVYLHGIGQVGTVVFRDYVNYRDPTDAPYKDFALIEIDEAHYDLVDPVGRFWGGPSGVETAFEPNTLTFNYGQGAVFSATEPTRPRVGVLHHAFEHGSNNNGDRFTGWFAATHPVQGGDSGGFLVSDEGKAIGVITWAADARGEDGFVLGPTFQQILLDLADAGFDLEVVTSPFHGDDAAALATTVAGSALHCGLEPGLGNPTSNACVREPLPWPWDAQVRLVGPVADPETPPVRADWVDRVSYFSPVVGVAQETPFGVIGAAANAFVNVPGFTPHEAVGVTVRSEDVSGDPVFFTVCIRIETGADACADTSGNPTLSGLGEVTVRALIPAGTWVAAYVYGTYIAADGTMTEAASGVFSYTFEGA